METINVSSETDTSAVEKSVANTKKRRRSSIFRPDEDYNSSALEKEYPEEYKEKLTKEKKEWEEMSHLVRSEYKNIKKRSSKQLQPLTIDETVLDQRQRDFLQQGPSPEQYLKITDEFLNKLQLCTAIKQIDFKAKQIERECLLSKMSFAENMILHMLNNKYPE